MAFVPVGCKEFLLIWGSSRRGEQPPGYVAQGGLKSVVSKRPSMASSRVHGRGSKSSALPSLVFIFTGVTQITLSSSVTQSPAS